MEKFLCFKSLIIISLFVFVGCKNLAPQIQDIQNEIQPEWECKLPGEAGIYNDGLIGLPVYENEIYFHSTYFTGPEGEDNRIHAVDMGTGKVNWTFPNAYQSGENMFFWGVPYQFNEWMVMKMPSFEKVNTNDKIVCLNLNTRSRKWDISMPDSLSFTAGNNIVGNEESFYFCQESSTKSYIFKGNIHSGDTSLLFQFENSLESAGVEISTELSLAEFKQHQYLVFGVLEWTSHKSDLEFENYLVIADPVNQKVIHKIHISKTEKFGINQIKCHDDKVWLTCGRNATCISLETGKILWNYYSPESLNYLTTGICLDEDVLFLWGDNRYQALNAFTGQKIYQNNLECGNADVFEGVVYLIGRDSKLYCVDINTGNVIQSVSCPEEKKIISTGFLTSCKPQVHKDHLYLFGNYHAYSYLLNDLIH